MMKQVATRLHNNVAEILLDALKHGVLALDAFAVAVMIHT